MFNNIIMSLTLEQEYLIVREMQVENFNEMKKLFPSCELRRHTIDSQVFDYIERKQYFFFFSTDWDDNIITLLLKKLGKYLNVCFVLPDNLKIYPKVADIKLKKIRVGGKYGSKPINKNSE